MLKSFSNKKVGSHLLSLTLDTTTAKFTISRGLCFSSYNNSDNRVIYSGGSTSNGISINSNFLNLVSVRYSSSNGLSNRSRLSVYRDKHLDDFRGGPPRSNTKIMKEGFLRDIMETKEEISGLFGDEERAAIGKNIQDADFSQREKEGKDYANEALRIYQMLRPDAPVFYKEEAMMSLQSRMNEVLLSQSPVTTRIEALNNAEQSVPSGLIPKTFDPLQFNLPVVNPRSFLLALEAATQSVADDLHDLCEVLNVLDLPSRGEPLRFKKLLYRLLRKDPGYVDEWMFDCWPRLRVIMPASIADLPPRAVAEWLKGHLQRVIINQQSDKSIKLHRKTKTGYEEWYNFGEDFIYDS